MRFPLCTRVLVAVPGCLKAAQVVVYNHSMINATDRAATEPMSGIPAMELGCIIDMRPIVRLHELARCHRHRSI